ncbi:ferulic acid esterase [Clohesyomyces aquaticus]|uniref:Carboxylic ester hydrolase n=1 Tax=Clohesyomyces aquaticus TaxID=1231657 RepID=A0A1Y1ZN68_9PLEO|nr:ferulic acid esterase [Clohesyomyces aquaticus]
MDKTCTSNAAPPLPVNICRLALNVTTSNSSSTLVETWLPEKWSGRFLATGTGGLSGCILYPDLAYATSYGFASIGHNAGHNGTSGAPFYHHPEVLQDFAWRSLYTGAKLGKSLTKRFYGDDKCKNMKSYYMGCSMGGRQGWNAVQSYPEMFDGALVGAPVLAGTGLVPWFATVLNALEQTPIADQNWAVIHEEILGQCDRLDGAVDGIVEDTRKCKPDLERLLCQNNQRSGCLSPQQLTTVHIVFDSLLFEGRVLSSGQSFGNEIQLSQFLNSPVPASWVNDWMRYALYGDTSWDRSQFGVQDIEALSRADTYNFAAFTGDLSAFRNHGGKVLHYHGQADNAIPIGNSDRYYAHVAETMHASSHKLDDFYRYFRISGMAHCGGGPGANILGQMGGLVAGSNPDDNMLTRLVQWVEHGQPPEFVRGTKFVNDDPKQGVAFTRKHCKYSQSNIYTGYGNGTDESGWHCV